MCHGNFKGVSDVFQENFMFLTVCFKEATRSSKEVLRVFQGNFKGDKGFSSTINLIS